jgi:hypothetical protein
MTMSLRTDVDKLHEKNEPRSQAEEIESALEDEAPTPQIVHAWKAWLKDPRADQIKFTEPKPDFVTYENVDEICRICNLDPVATRTSIERRKQLIAIDIGDVGTIISRTLARKIRTVIERIGRHEAV